jgi:hypothetical protein
LETISGKIFYVLVNFDIISSLLCRFAVIKSSGYVIKITKINSVALVRERTIPTERTPLIGEVSAIIHRNNFELGVSFDKALGL